ncbi:MAG: hypothetical protein KGZ85_14755 [Ignavibacterium sp.]|nr:hypothetical protein [Ignavibacterium sp.]
MYNGKKRILKKPIVFYYRSLNPFGESKNDANNRLNSPAHKAESDKIYDENEWRVEYEMIYRSHQLER